MDVEDIARRLRIAAADGDVLDRARELERLAGAHVRQQARIALPVVAFDLACAEFGCPIDRDAAIRLSAVPKKVYIETLKLMSSTAHARSATVTFRNLAVQFGCTDLVRDCERLHSRFAAQYAERNGGAKRSQEVVNLPMYVAAVFLLAATHHKVRLGRRELQKVCLVTEKQLDRASALVLGYVPKPFEEPAIVATKSDAPSRAAARRTPAASDAGDAGDAVPSAPARTRVPDPAPAAAAAAATTSAAKRVGPSDAQPEAPTGRQKRGRSTVGINAMIPAGAAGSSDPADAPMAADAETMAAFNKWRRRLLDDVEEHLLALPPNKRTVRADASLPGLALAEPL